MLLFSSAYNEYTVISKEYTGPLDFDITGVDCIIIIVLILKKFLNRICQEIFIPSTKCRVLTSKWSLYRVRPRKKVELGRGLPKLPKSR